MLVFVSQLCLTLVCLPYHVFFIMFITCHSLGLSSVCSFPYHVHHVSVYPPGLSSIFCPLHHVYPLSALFYPFHHVYPLSVIGLSSLLSSVLLRLVGLLTVHLSRNRTYVHCHILFILSMMFSMYSSYFSMCRWVVVTL